MMTAIGTIQKGGNVILFSVVLGLFLLSISAALPTVALAQAPPISSSTQTSLSDPVVMQRDQQRSRQLSAEDRARAIRLFEQAYSLYQAGDFESAKLGFERCVNGQLSTTA